MAVGAPADAARDDVIVVLVVDDHPALRAGLEGLLEYEHGFACSASVATEHALEQALARSRPDVVLLDYALAEGDGLSACFRVKQRPDPPGVVLYSAYVDRVFAVPAVLAQADAILSKTAPVDELLRILRGVAAGARYLPALDPEAMEAASSRLQAEDLPIVGMLMSRVPVAGIAETLDLHPREVRSRALRMIGELQAHDRLGARASRGELEWSFPR